MPTPDRNKYQHKKKKFQFLAKYRKSDIAWEAIASLSLKASNLNCQENAQPEDSLKVVINVNSVRKCLPLAKSHVYLHIRLLQQFSIKFREKNLQRIVFLKQLEKWGQKEGRRNLISAETEMVFVLSSVPLSLNDLSTHCG